MRIEIGANNNFTEINGFPFRYNYKMKIAKNTIGIFLYLYYWNKAAKKSLSRIMTGQKTRGSNKLGQNNEKQKYIVENKFYKNKTLTK